MFAAGTVKAGLTARFRLGLLLASLLVDLGDLSEWRQFRCDECPDSAESDTTMSDMGVPVPAPLKRFIWDIQSMVELAESEREILVIGRDLMARLVASDDWLPVAFASPGATQCRPYLLYGDDLERFCVVSTVLDGAQAMLVCQHGVWEILGLLRGAMRRQRLRWEPGRRAPAQRGRQTRRTGFGRCRLAGEW